MLHMPTPMLLGGSREPKTRAQFNAYIAAVATNIGWTSNSIVAAGAYWVTGSDAAGAMIGSSWGSVFRIGAGNTNPSRLVQHACPDLGAFVDIAGNGYSVLFRVIAATAPSGYQSLNRNSFSSTASANTTLAAACDWFLYYDNILGPMEIKPNISSGPAPFDW